LCVAQFINKHICFEYYANPDLSVAVRFFYVTWYSFAVLRDTIVQGGPRKSSLGRQHSVNTEINAVAIEDDQRWGAEMVTARLLTDCSDTLCDVHTNARENITRTRAKRKAGYFFVAHSV